MRCITAGAMVKVEGPSPHHHAIHRTERTPTTHAPAPARRSSAPPERGDSYGRTQSSPRLAALDEPVDLPGDPTRREALSREVRTRMSSDRARDPMSQGIAMADRGGLTVGDRSLAVKRNEERLKRAGFNPGTVDRNFDDGTARAVSRFQESVGIAPTGVLDERTRDRLAAVDKRIRKHDGKLLGPGVRNRRTLEAEQRLKRLGYDPGKVDGVYDRDTGRAMQQFRADEGRKKGSLLAGTPTLRQLRNESRALNHDPYHARVKDSRARRRDDARAALASRRVHADGTVGMGEGSRGPSVRWVQKHLRAAGYDPKHTNGVFDERTRGMVEQFQRRSDLPVTGRVDSATFRKLRHATLESKGSFDPPQRLGERSGSVKRTEQMLKYLGYHPGKVDGTYTAQTQKAVDAFRRKRHLGSLGGGVGPRVHKALLKAVKAKRNRLPTRTGTGYINGNPYRLKLAKIDGEWTGVATARAYQRMERAARRDGIDLDIVSGFRTMAEQRDLYNRYGPGRAAVPGYSNHQNGRALDLNVQTAPGQISVGVGAVYNWLARNAGRFGFHRIDLEAWHWEYRG